MYKIGRLKNGIRVVTEKTDYVKSVSLGVWVGAGSAFENISNNGISHFIEHMLFKGTKKRSAGEIAKCMDSVGGQLNALTAKEYTCFYAKTLTQHFPLAADVLSDMLTGSRFSVDCIETERSVIGEEINMCEDTPEDNIHDRLSSLMWQGSSLGYPIAGTTETIAGINREKMLGYMNDFYCGENIVICAVGNFDEKKMLDCLENCFGKIKPEGKKTGNIGKLSVGRSAEIIKKDIEQCHICIGIEGLERNNLNFYDLLIINALFGGNMSSRLFQKVREEKGLAYSIYSYANSYKNNGSLVIYAGLSANRLCETLEIINREAAELLKNGLKREEIGVAKVQMKSSLVMGLEGTSSRMSSYGRSLLFDNNIKTLDSIIEQIDKVDFNSVNETIERVFNSDKLCLAALGRVEQNEGELLDILNF